MKTLTVPKKTSTKKAKKLLVTKAAKAKIR
jgi:hypothetical protein